jgi:energy-coupling factor transport system substrate-specific component
MSWQLASFAVLVAVLLAGFAWYERSRPPSQVVALVAALAALAVAGRIALVALPNVVATTDIALFAGYSLGAAPGFAVGSLAAVVSNFWLGQGPWTPWQMAAWGLCGAGGALLALITRRRAGRLALAAAAGVAAVLYGAILNFSLMVSYGGEQSLERFLALEARAVPFDAAHAIGNVALALVAGPAIVRMLSRFRARFEWRRADPRRPSAALPAGAAVLLACLVWLAPPGADPASAAGRADAVVWLVRAQNPDGGFAAAPGDASSPEMTGWAMLGLEAAGRNPRDVRSGGRSAVAYLRRNAGEITTTGDVERTILALRGAGVDPRSFAGRNLVAGLRGRMRRDGSFGGQVNLTAFGVLALRSAGGSRGLRQSLSWLRGAQNRDGGWGFAPGAPSDADSTGAALQAVRGSRSARLGIRYLRRHQARSGGWTLAGGGAVNSQSTAWALQGLIAAGVDPGSVRRRGRSGLDYLAARQAGDGHYQYSARNDQTPAWVTAQALIPLAGASLPLDPAPRRRRSGTESSGADGRAPGAGRRLAPPAIAGPEPDAGEAGGRGAGSPVPGGAAPSRPGEVGQGRRMEVSTPEPARSATPAEQPDGPSPGAPIAIGIAAGALTLAGLWLAGRRRGW